MNFIPLRIHTSYTDGSESIEDIVQFAERNNLRAVGITDREDIRAWGEISRLAEEREIKPILGVEITVNSGSLLLYPIDDAGYFELAQILNHRLDPASSTHILKVYIPRGRFVPDFLENKNTYIGVTVDNMGIAVQLSQKTGIKLLFVPLIKYLEDFSKFLLVTAIKNKTLLALVKEKYRGSNPFGVTEIETSVSPELKEAMFNTFEVVERIDFNLKELQFPPPTFYSESLKEIATGALKNDNPLYKERLMYELDVIEKSGFSPYFMLVRDIANYMKERGILFNLRGSGAASLVAYVLGISKIDPLKFNLPFERFLNPGRREPPDIDIDIASGRRDEVLKYLFNNYKTKLGLSFVATFKTYRARSALQDTLRALGFAPYKIRELIAKIPHFIPPAELKKFRMDGLEHALELASKLQGLFYQASLHVGGILITPHPAEDFIPLMTAQKGFPMAPFDKYTAEDMKLIKLDLLSVRGLQAMEDTLNMVGMSVDDIPLQDEETYKRLGEGRTIGCFQIESPGMMALLKRLKPRNLSDMTMALALIRPGPTESGMKERLLKIREGRESEDFTLRDILKDTSGILLFEEQVMEVCVKMAGFSLEEAESMRRALKKGGSKKLFKKFTEGGLKRGYDEKTLRRILRLLLHFSSYTFNKAHSASYGLMGYISAYLKTHFKLPYFVSLLNAGGGYYDLMTYIEETKREGIEILPPDVTKSELLFSIYDGKILTGLLFIKNLERETALKIIEERKKRAFLDIFDFMGRVGAKKNELVSLAESGALDSLEPNRAKLFFEIYTREVPSFELKDHTENEKKLMMFNSLGFIPSNHPLEFFERDTNRIDTIKTKGGGKVVARVVDARVKRVKRGEKLFAILEDETGIIECVASPSFAHNLKNYVEVTLKKKGTHFIVESARPLVLPHW